MIGSSELAIILILALLLFGPKKLPELARSIGKATGEYHKAAREFEKEATGVKKSVKEIERDAERVNKEIMNLEKGAKDIEHIAKNLGISTKDKNEATLLKEIGDKTKHIGR
ncbi:MAG: twin-arginine translocase TatA/TatE family subunit [Candidatus Hydrothermarchaeota archaeon]|jgi:sec-independent protein translocase protein TatA|nr:twin-arginine translocase TatA/TatE family subunit [Candidatus Hydrothermarchaeota archaeon]|tara:strand:- start:218 stop:553 length:336 start_codon:yes stop_codon:yes gene_type:complete